MEKGVTTVSKLAAFLKCQPVQVRGLGRELGLRLVGIRRHYLLSRSEVKLIMGVYYSRYGRGQRRSQIGR